MWLVTQHGFFNIVEQDDDKRKELLTVKARTRKDIEFASGFFDNSKIEESDKADYRFRTKATATSVTAFVSYLARSIDYGKTKEALHKAHPERSGIYFGVWDILSEIQTLPEK